jgi:hypothetical protein
VSNSTRYPSCHSHRLLSACITAALCFCCRSQSPRTPQSPVHQVKRYHSSQAVAPFCCATCSLFSALPNRLLLTDHCESVPCHGSKCLLSSLMQVEDASAELAALGLPVGFGKHEVRTTVRVGLMTKPHTFTEAPQLSLLDRDVFLFGPCRCCHTPTVN